MSRQGTRYLLPLLAVAALVRAEVNPPHPAAAKGLAKKEVCLRYAREVGEHLLDADTGKRDVYSGDAGVALFLVDLHAATGEKRWLEAARKLLDRALELDAKAAPDKGLYTGTAGVGQVCLDAFRASGEEAFLDRARACAGRIARAGPYTVVDVISGAAGTGIFLLNLHAATGEAAHLAQARAAGDYLARTAVRGGGKAHWPIGGRVYLGFSHGAAGVAYFLLHLHRATGDPEYLALAREGAAFVLAHESPGGRWLKMTAPFDETKNPCAVQWCHGSPGIGLLFCDLGYEEPLRRCVAATLAEGRTARVGGCQCHGVAGNAELLVEAYRRNGDEALLEAARTFGSALLEPHGDGFRVATGVGGYRYPPGYMLGIAGIGRFFLRLAAPGETPLPLMVR